MRMNQLMNFLLWFSERHSLCSPMVALQAIDRYSYCKRNINYTKK